MTKPSTGRELTLTWNDSWMRALLPWFSRWVRRQCSRQEISTTRVSPPFGALGAARFCWSDPIPFGNHFRPAPWPSPTRPIQRFFPRAAVIVHSGGIGTSAQALAAGRPMLVVPFAFDQPDNAARLQRLGVARAIPRKHYTAKRAYAELSRLLTDPAYAASAGAGRA